VITKRSDGTELDIQPQVRIAATKARAERTIAALEANGTETGRLPRIAVLGAGHSGPVGPVRAHRISQPV
jgi:arginase family enzyme